MALTEDLTFAGLVKNALITDYFNLSVRLSNHLINRHIHTIYELSQIKDAEEFYANRSWRGKTLFNQAKIILNCMELDFAMTDKAWEEWTQNHKDNFFNEFITNAADCFNKKNQQKCENFDEDETDGDFAEAETEVIPQADVFFKFYIEHKILSGVDWRYTEEQDLRNLTINIPKEIDEINKIFTSGMYLRRYVRNVIIPEGVKKIGYGVFSGCISLESVNIPETVLSIGAEAFSGCSRLKKIELPKGITKISYGMFANCPKLEELILPDSVSLIEENAFYGCENLSKINIPKNLEKIEAKAFYGCKIYEMEVPSSVNYVGQEAFACSSLKKIAFLSSNLEICSRAFFDCCELRDVKFPSCCNIACDSFEGCGNLEANNNYYLSQVAYAENLAVENPFKALQLLYDYCQHGYIKAAKSVCKILINNDKVANPKWPLYEQKFLDYAAELCKNGDEEVFNDVMNLLSVNPKTKDKELAEKFKEKLNG